MTPKRAPKDAKTCADADLSKASVNKPRHLATVCEAIRRLASGYPDARIALTFANPWELLVATILSAQSTDKKINEITPGLFAKYPTVKDFAEADQAELEQDVHQSGFFRMKSKHIVESARLILERFGGEVPRTMAELTTLPGVARKTANVVLGNAFGVVEGIAVDTHVFRLAHRLGWTTANDPDKVEQDLLRIIPAGDWYRMNYLLIDHGRAVCVARWPHCDGCALAEICPSAFQFPNFQGKPE
jgi:endonuclease III